MERNLSKGRSTSLFSKTVFATGLFLSLEKREWFERCNQMSIIIWDKVFKNGPSKICGGHPIKNLKGYGLVSRTYPFKLFKGCLLHILLDPFLNTLFHIFIKLGY